MRKGGCDMTLCDLSTQLWPYERVQVVDRPEWKAINEVDGASLWLDGARNEQLEAEVAALSALSDREWIWRDTPWEYAGPGYRQGPLLVRLSEALMERYLSEWATSGTGLILLSDDRDQVVRHLQHLRHITAANGDRVHFSLRAFRKLEELCEGLTSQGLGRLLGPIRSVLWCHPGESGAWRRADNPSGQGQPLKYDAAFQLSDAEEDALNRACANTFMRRAVGRLCLDPRAQVQLLAPEELKRQLEMFVGESQRIGLMHERDIYHYACLRFIHPQKPFMRSEPVHRILADREVVPRLRLRDAEWMLEKQANVGK